MQTTPTATSTHTTVNVADTAPKTDRWELAAVEITAAGATASTTTYSYNAQGDRTGISPPGQAAVQLAYDQANRLISYGTTATYAYNGDCLRMSKTANGTTTSFTWDQSGSVPLLLTSGATSFIYGPGGQPIERINSNSTPTYLQTDQQGSVRLLTNSVGAVVGTYTYGPYGNTLSHTGTATIALQYDGQYTDAESGFLYLENRYYDPGTGQFLTRDPLLPATGEPYSYADDNPLNAFDPIGLSWYNPVSWSSKTWAAVGIGVAVVGVGVLTFGAGDVVIGASATFVSVTAIDTEALAVTDVTAVSVSAEFTLGEAVGPPNSSPRSEAWHGEYTTPIVHAHRKERRMRPHAGSVALDALSESLIGEHVPAGVKTEIANGAAAALSLGYDYFKDWLLSKLQGGPSC